jgi:hypothetical protein
VRKELRYFDGFNISSKSLELEKFLSHSNKIQESIEKNIEIISISTQIIV